MAYRSPDESSRRSGQRAAAAGPPNRPPGSSSNPSTPSSGPYRRDLSGTRTVRSAGAAPYRRERPAGSGGPGDSGRGGLFDDDRQDRYFGRYGDRDEDRYDGGYDDADHGGYPSRTASRTATRPGGRIEARRAEERRAGTDGRGGGGAGGGRGRPPGRKRFIDYPRFGKTGIRRWLPSWKLVTGVFLFVVLLICAGFFTLYQLTPLPNANAVAVSQTSVITYSNGKTMARLAAQNRENVSIDRVPKGVQEAVLAAEDRDFYTEPGFSVTGIFRAAWVSLTGGDLQGGSTITQQYVKKTYLTDARTPSRKAKELVLAIKVERSQSKQQILERYLNTVYFGRGAYGVQTAAHAYFGKDVSKLTPSEGAVLASVIRNPTLYDPDNHRDNLEARWHYVMNGMASKGWLDGGQAATAKFPKIAKEQRDNQYQGEAGYLIQMVKEELARKGITEDMLLTGGYRVRTTFDPRMIKAARYAVRTAYPDAFKQANVAIGLAAVEPGTGEIKAIYGGRNYLKQQINHATSGGMTQPGSSFKPYVLATALQDGVSLRTTYNSASPQVIAGATIHNDGGEQMGYTTLDTATEHSLNTVFVRLGQDVGLKKVAKNARAVGLQTSPWCPLNKASTRMDPSFVSMPLGPMDICPLEQAGGYATFANGGKYVEPTTLLKVTNASGSKVIYQAKPDEKQVFSKGVSADTLYAMQKVVQGGTGTAARLPDGRPVAGKTGTSSFNRAAWFSGTVPQLSTAVAMYKANGHQIPRVGGYNTVYGGTIPAHVWEVFMAKATEHMKVEQFPDPAYVGEVKYDHPTGVPTHSSRPTDTQTSTPTGSDTPTSTPTASQPSPTPSQSTSEGVNPPSPSCIPRVNCPKPTPGGGGGGKGGGGNGNGNGNGGKDGPDSVPGENGRRPGD